MPKQVDPDERRRQLVEASWKVIAEQGIEGVTLRKVAEAASCTTGRIAHYFADRDELIRSALKAAHSNAASRIETIAQAALPAEDRLRAVVHEALPLDARRLREWKVWIVFWSAAISNPSLAASNVRRYAAWQGLIESLLAEFSSASDVREKALELVSLVDGLGIRTTLAPTPPNRRLARAAVDHWMQSC